MTVARPFNPIQIPGKIKIKKKKANKLDNNITFEKKLQINDDEDASC